MTLIWTSLIPSLTILPRKLFFYAPRYVAIFPENIVWPKVSGESCPVFYFVNKFIDRFLSVTKPAISNNIIHSANFSDILDADYDEILNVAVSWIPLHEYFHSEGIIPYTKSRMIKSTRSTAALEELRVDIIHARWRNALLSIATGTLLFIAIKNWHLIAGV